MKNLRINILLVLSAICTVPNAIGDSFDFRSEHALSNAPEHNTHTHSLLDFVSPPLPNFESDSLALVALYNATDGPNWIDNTNWLTGPLDTWVGTNIATGPGGGRVNLIALPSNGLNGTIPSEIYDMDQLQILQLSDQNITGSISATIANLSSLQVLLLQKNQLTGSVPNLDNLSSLIYLDVSQNQFSEFPDVTSISPPTVRVVNNRLTFESLEPNIPLSSFDYTPQDSIGQVVDTVLVESSPFSFSIPVGGTANQYQWYKDGMLLPGETGSLFSLATVALSDSGIYHLEVTNSIVTGLTLVSRPINVHVQGIAGGNLMTDSLALVALYNATDGTNWINNTNWLTGPVSTWFGVTVANDVVIGIDLANNSLAGSLPSEIGDLSKLASLKLRLNQLIGSIPTEIGELADLTFLDLAGNQLVGTIPVELANLMNLRDLNLSFNQLTGIIPVELTGLISLSNLDLGVNQLSGSIPTEIENLINLYTLMLGANQLSGTIPASLGNLTSLLRLRLHFNQLAGTIPPELGSLINLNTLELSLNQLTGAIPPQLGNIPDLHKLDLSENQLSGPIPSELGNLASLNTMSLQGNRLSGPLPAEFGSLTALQNLSVSNNLLTGNIPSSIGNLENIQSMDYNENLFSGSITAELGNASTLKILNLGKNQFMGNIPKELGNLSNLEVLQLNHNNLTDSVPNELSNLSNLVVLDLASNELSHLIDLTGLTSLLAVIAQNNKFTFEDLESNISITTFRYSPQDSIGTDVDTTLQVGSSFTISFPVGGTANQYQWYKNGVLIPDQTGSILTLPSVILVDSGVYHLEVTSSIVNDLTLVSHSLNISVQSIMPDGLATDSLALVALYNATDGPNWNNNANWLTGPVDSWFGVTVANDTVTDISLPFNGLVGSLPSEIGDFSGLMTLNASSNQLQGTIPNSISNLQMLEILDLRRNQLSDSISSAILSLNSLQELHLGANSISGSIPDSINQLANLRVLNLGGSDLVGNIPVTLGDLTLLEEMYLSQNQLSGSIPLELGNLGNLRFLHLGGNDTNGTIPPEIGNLVNLEDLALYSMNLVSPLPNELSNLVNLRQLLLYDNDFTGPFPDLITSLNNLEDLFLSANDFTGPLPTTISQLSKLRTLSLSSNAFSGSLPVEIGSLSNLFFLVIGDNNFSGELPTEVGNLTQLQSATLNFNAFIGNPFDVLTNISTLSSVLLHGNEFTGQIPSDVSNWTNLRTLWIHNNEFFGPIPDELASLTLFSSFLAYHNDFTYLPDLSALNINTASVAGNQLSFESLEPNVGLPSFQYNSQQAFGTEIDTILQIGSSFTLSFSVGGTANQYQWYKDGVLIPGATDSALVLDPFLEINAGVYQLQAQNAIVTDLTLFSNDVRLGISLSSCPTPGNFEIPDQDVTCSNSTFMIPIEAINPVSNEVIGMDFCVTYDTTLMTPTGDAIIGNVAHGGNPSVASSFINVNTPGEVNGLIFFNGSAPFPSYFSGNGTVVELEFQYNGDVPPGTVLPIQLCGVTESTLFNGDSLHCNESEQNITVINDPSFTGTLKFWNVNGKRLLYDTLNPTAYNATAINGSDALCNDISSTTFYPNLNGQFSYEVEEGDYFTISRDIPGSYADSTNCTNMMSLINGTDQNRAMKIATLDPSFSPNVYQIIAADVNQNGRVNAADVTFISARSVMNICGFTSNGVNSIEDWLFVDETTTNTDPSFSISAAFPMDDGVGYSRNRVPVVPDCLVTPISTIGQCSATTEEDYVAILMGDVNGNWKSSDGENARSEQNQLLMMDFDRMSKNGNNFEIPLVIKGTEVEALDFNMKFNSDKISIDQVTTNSVSFNANFNVHGDMLLYSSYALAEEMLSGDILILRVSTYNDYKPSASDFSSASAYVNGHPVDITDKVELFYEDKWNIYPIPFSGNLTVDYLGSDEVEIIVTVTNTTGQIIKNITSTSRPGFQLKLNLEEVGSGIYFMKIKTPVAEFTRKLVK
ncbi:MAG: T9SS type A sorting domain-containing protein [Cyclobacteriaceae bacterium]